jgi:hypothetical protein
LTWAKSTVVIIMHHHESRDDASMMNWDSKGWDDDDDDRPLAGLVDNPRCENHSCRAKNLTRNLEDRLRLARLRYTKFQINE